MDLNAYIRLIRRWLWLIVLAAVVAASASFVTARTQAAQYQASTTIQVGAYLNLANPSSGMIQNAADLAETYAALLKTYPILNVVVTKLQLPLTPDGLAGLFQTRLVNNTSLMTITVTYTDPVVAADIANELAAQLIINSPTNLTKAQQDQLDTLQTQIDLDKKLLQEATDELSTVNIGLSGGNGADQAVLTVRKSELEKQINTTQATLSQFTTSAIALQQQGNINSLRVVEPSRIPDSPIGPSTLSRTLLPAAVGALLAIGAAFVIEYFNDSLRSPSEVAPLLGVPLLGTIAPFGRKGTYQNKLITWAQPRSSISEAYRALRVNLLFGDSNSETESDRVNQPTGLRIFAVTSGGPSEGKSLTVANLAVTFAITGMRVLIIDADLRRPSQHFLLNMPNIKGLSSIWLDKTLIPDNTQAVADLHSNGNTHRSNGTRDGQTQYLSQIAQKTEIPGLDVITAGPTPTNPAELLDTPQMRELMRQIAESELYDVVFFDTPPTLVVTDTNVIANVTKAKMIVVIEAGRTRRASAQRMLQQLSTLSVTVLGVVMNRLNPRDMDAGYGQYYYGYTRYGNPTSKTPEKELTP